MWEAAMFAAHYKLDNLCVIVDNNGLQIDGQINQVMNPEPVSVKLEAFDFFVQVVNGHNFPALEQAFWAAQSCKGRPSAVVMRTTKGQGVSFMENQVGWYGKTPDDQQYLQAMAELKAELKRWEDVKA